MVGRRALRAVLVLVPVGAGACYVADPDACWSAVRLSRCAATAAAVCVGDCNRMDQDLSSPWSQEQLRGVAALPSGPLQRRFYTALRRTHAYVCIWGGDTVHALHMRHSSAVIELRGQRSHAELPISRFHSLTAHGWHG